MHSILENELVKASIISLHRGACNFLRSHSVGEIEPIVRSISLSNHRKLDVKDEHLEDFCCTHCDRVTHQLYKWKKIIYIYKLPEEETSKTWACSIPSQKRAMGGTPYIVTVLRPVDGAVFKVIVSLLQLDTKEQSGYCKIWTLNWTSDNHYYFPEAEKRDVCLKI